MRRFTTQLGGDHVLVFAPEVGDPNFSTEMLRLYFPSNGFYGLDVESTAFRSGKDAPGEYGMRGGPGVFDPSWKLRTVQFGTEGYAWVLNVEDPAQKAAAINLLADLTVQFTSHTKVDALAVDVAFGIDITDRMLDTYPLTVMNSPDDRDGGNDLKTHVTALIGPELQAAEHEMEEEFVSLYRERNQVMVDVEGDVMRTPKGKPRVVGETTAVKVGITTGWGFTNISADSPRYLTYAGLDAVAVRRLAPKLIANSRATPTLLRSERWLSQQSIKISRRGHRVDEQALDKLYTETRDALAEPRARFQEITGGINPRGSKVVPWFEEQGVDFEALDHPLTKSGKGPSLSKEDVPLLLDYDLSSRAREAAEVLITMKALLNRETVTEQIRDRMVDGFIHPTIKTVGTVTGRMSSSDPNMQNFAKSDRAMRGLFLPREGRALMSADYAQIELRVLAGLAGVDSMIETIKAGGDLHQLTADLLNISRQAAKTVNFLIVYGGGGAKLARQLGTPEGMSRQQWISECYETIREYWRQYPEIDQYKRWAECQRELELISGRKVPADLNRMYANLNYMIQGSARELLAGSWLRFGRDFGRAEFMWMPIHDEFVLEVPEDLVEVVSKEVTEAMTFEFQGVPIEASPDALIDEHGTSRWMSGDAARECFCYRRGHHVPNPLTPAKCDYCGNAMTKELIAA